MSMMIVGSGVSNAPVTPNSVPASHSTNSVSLSGAGSVVGQPPPPPAHMTQLTSAPVIGNLGQAAAAAVVPLSHVGHRAVLEQHPAPTAAGDPQPAHHGSMTNTMNSPTAAAASPNSSSLASGSGFTYGGSHGASGQHLPQVLTQHHSTSHAGGQTGSGPGTSPGGTTYGHSLPQPCTRPVSGRPLQSPSGRTLTNGLQSGPPQLARTLGLANRRTPSGMGGQRSYVSSRPSSGSSHHQASPHPPTAQHHLPQAPQPRESTYAPRSMPMFPQRPNPKPRSQSSSRLHGYGGGGGGSGGSSTPVGGSTANLPLMAPSPAQHLFTSVNSPSLIPTHSFLPQIPIQLTPAAGPSSPQYRVGSPQCRVGSPLPAPDNAILPPNELKKFTRSIGGAEDDVDQHDLPGSFGRRNLISPRQRERRNLLNHVSLQDHNYCAAPLPSPPRSPTPPLSPYIPSVPPASSSSMGAAAQSCQQQQHHTQDHQQHHHPHHQHHHHTQHQVHHAHQESFSFGIAGYRDGVSMVKDAANSGSGGAASGVGGSSGQDKSHHLAASGSAADAGGALAVGVSPAKESTSTVGAYPSPHYSGNTGDRSPLSRLKQTIEDAGVGPMTPLGHESSPLHGDKSIEPDESPDSRPSPDRDGGEETETAPEAEDEGGDDAVTRCICDYLHDDGYMICCDKCSVWQHVVCMFIDKDNIPDEYLCEKCQPRPVDRKRAKNLQRAREKEIFKTLPVDSSEDERKPMAVVPPKGRKAAVGTKKSFAGGLKKGAGSAAGVGSGLGGGTANLIPEKKQEKKLTKKPVKRRTLKETLTGMKADRKVSPRKNQRRKSASATDIETEEENANDASALRSWIDTYEEAVTNHYSPELRARLQGVKLPTTQFKPKEVNGIRCNVSLRGNGVKVLTANSYIPANTPIIECRGKYMLASQLSSRARNSEFVLLHKINSDLEVCVDCKTYGNDSRFCRRAESDSAKFNAEVKHHLDKGSLHLYIVSTRTIDKNQEILLGPLDNKPCPNQPQLSIQDELRQIKKVNGLIDEKKSRKSASVKQRRLKREVKKELCDSSSDEDMPVTMRKTRSNVEKQTEKSVNFNLSSSNNVKKEVKVEDIKEEKEVKTEKENRVEKENKVVKSEKKVKAEPVLDFKAEKVKQEPKLEIKEEKVEQPVDIIKPELSSEKEDKVLESPPLSTTATPAQKQDAQAQAAAKSPGKPVLGLPDQSGLIVGVNTINYDVSLRNKSMSREEKKMEMILKAIAAMEKAESRKKNDSGDGGTTERAPAKRRRSNSNKKEHGAGDSNIDSSCDETGLDIRADRPKAPKGKRKRNISLRRRSRAKSGDSTSAMSADESATTPNIENESSSTPSEGAPFKFPYKKHQDGDDVDDDVSGHYIRGSKSPPGIANHLLRSAVTNNAGIKSPTKSIGCSAKKRWLRAAMSEDHNEETQGSGAGGGAGSSPALSSGGAGASPGQEPDYTPLKKRRLATYNESTEEKESKPEQEKPEEKLSKTQVTEKFKSLPNGLKKRLISNLLLNAVLDNAIQDILPDQDLASSPTESEKAAPSPPPPDEKEPEPSESKPVPDTPTKTTKRSRAVRKGTKGKKSGVEPEENGLEEENTGASSSSSVAADKNTSKTDKTDSQEDVKKPEAVGSSDAKSTEIRDKILNKDSSSSNTDSLDSVTSNTSATAATAATSSDKSREVDSEKPPTPIQHSVFKSFFSTDLSIDDIDRQIEAKRVELARENSLASSLPSPRLDFDNLPTRSSLRSDLKPLLTSTASAPSETSSPSTPSTPTLTRKKVSIADYKKRKQANLQQQGENQTDSASVNSTPTTGGSRMSSLLSTCISSLPPVSLPELPGLAATTTSSQKHKSSAPLFQPKRTRSNSPLSNDKKSSRCSPLTEKKNSRGSTPQESRTRSGSPLEKKGVSPAKSRDRTGSPRRMVNSFISSSQKHERWESKSMKERETHKGLKQNNSPMPLGKRVPVSTPVLSPPTIPAAPPSRPTIHTPDMPREDLTERLRKEFGLNIEDSEGEDGSDSDSGGGGGDFPGSGLRRAATHNGPERTNGWREEEKSGGGGGGGGFWGQR